MADLRPMIDPSWNDLHRLDGLLDELDAELEPETEPDEEADSVNAVVYDLAMARRLYGRRRRVRSEAGKLVFHL